LASKLAGEDQAHRNPGQRQLNPFWPVRTHLKRHMSQSDAR
jgi:hypothetical protein